MERVRTTVRPADRAKTWNWSAQTVSSTIQPGLRNQVEKLPFMSRSKPPAPMPPTGQALPSGRASMSPGATVRPYVVSTVPMGRSKAAGGKPARLADEWLSAARAAWTMSLAVRAPLARAAATRASKRPAISRPASSVTAFSARRGA